jgi:TatD DNase family protein
MTTYLDTHCHLDLFEDPMRTLQGAPDTVVVAVSELPSGFRLLEARFRSDRRVRVALGLHPLRAHTAGPIEEGQFIRSLTRTEYVGEIGLDFSRHGRDTKTSQLRVLDRLLAEPLLQHRVVTAHSRGAEKLLIERFDDAGITAILHWYTGPVGLIDSALAAGHYFSVNPSMMRTDKGRATIAALPRDRVLTESDGPFAKTGPRSVEPVDMARLASELGRQWDITQLEAAQIVHDNLANLYAATVGTATPSPRG